MQLLDATFDLHKARGRERARHEQLLSSSERKLKREFVAYVKNVRSPHMRREITRLLADNNISGATKLVEQHIAAFGRAMPGVFVDVAREETKVIAAKAGFIAKAKVPAVGFQVSVGFDPSNPQAARLMQLTQLNFVQQVTDGQRAAIRQALANTYRDGGSTRDAVKSFIGSLGLTQSQVEAVDNYRTLLTSGSAEALDRQLRDRRYDAATQRAVDGEPLTPAMIDTMVSRYEANMLNMRGDTISRTEGLSVFSQARQEAMDQVLGQAGFDRSTVRRTWRSVQDSRTRDSHLAMDGQTVGMDEPFVAPSGEELMYPGDPSASPGERINCRCTIEMEFN